MSGARARTRAPTAAVPAVGALAGALALAAPATLDAQAPGGAAPGPEPEAVAVALASELATVPWGSTCAEWGGGVPGADCEAFHGDGSWTFFHDRWCFEGRAPGLAGVVHFYAIPDTTRVVGAEPTTPRCDLGEYHAVVELPETSASAAHAALVRRLDARLGPSRASSEPVHEWGSAYWEAVRAWSTDGFDVLAWRRPENAAAGPSAVGLLARSRSLLDATATDDAWQRHAGPDPHAEAAADVVRPRSEAVAERVAVDPWSGPAFDEPFPRAEAMAVLADLLADAERATGEERAALLFAADYVADRAVRSIEPAPVQSPDDPWTITQPEAEAVRDLGLTVIWNELGHIWAFEHDPLVRLPEELPETSWGERAAVILIGRGWSGAGICPGGMDAFRPVIEHGEPFLSERPGSPWRRQVARALAEAHETWWSLSLAGPDAYYVDDPSVYAEGAEDARLRAIELWSELAEGGGPDRWEAAWRLPRLRLGIDTNQRAYFCVYD